MDFLKNIFSSKAEANVDAKVKSTIISKSSTSDSNKATTHTTLSYL